MSEAMNNTNASAPVGPFQSEADCMAYMKWFDWYMNFRVFLHEVPFIGDADTDILNQFLDAYGLAVDTAEDSQGIIDFICDMPPQSSWHPKMMPVPQMMGRVWDALDGKPIDFPSEGLSTAAVALRKRAAFFLEIAEAIEQGTFKFPKPNETSGFGQQG